MLNLYDLKMQQQKQKQKQKQSLTFNYVKTSILALTSLLQLKNFESITCSHLEKSW